jgi:hypothetical protein
MENLTKEQIEHKKEQLKKLMQEANALKDELVAAGAWPVDDDDLDDVAGGMGLLPMDIFGKFR